MENNFDIKKFTSQMSEVIQERDKLLYLKMRYIEHAKALKQFAETIKENADGILNLAGAIDPVASVKRRRASNIDYKELAHEVHTKMLSGLYVTRELLEKTYPQLSKENIYVLINTLVKVKGVEKTKDGRNVRLFVKQTGGF